MDRNLHFHIPMYSARGIANAMPVEARLAFLKLAKESPEAAQDLVKEIVGEIEIGLFGRERAETRQFEATLLIGLTYTLPRMTTSGSAVRETIIEYWDSLSEETKSTIHDRIEQAIANDRAGDRMDVRSWKTILDLPRTDAATLSL